LAAAHLQTIVKAVVCLPTHRRPAMLRRTLESLAAQKTSIGFAVIVVDNDPQGQEGTVVAREFFERGRLRGFAVVEGELGNCRACNRALDEARIGFPGAAYVLMIDDDEVASPLWLDRLTQAAETSGADIVGGPVVPRFEGAVSAAFAQHPVYLPAYTASGFVPMIYGSGNFLIRRGALERLDPPRFDLSYNYLGGGDMHFFTRCRRGGLSFYWEQAALAEETVPDERMRIGWVAKRSLRIGVINYRVDRSFSHTALSRMKLLAKNLVLVPVSTYRAVCLVMKGAPFLVAAHPITVALGRILASFGYKPEAYRPLGRSAER
jgi:glycosyltransferase involved in cell wall biosynthesis